VPVLSLDALAERIRQLKPAAGATAVVAIDGPAGSGKTMLARQLSQRLDAPVVHMDDLYPGWDGLAEAAVRIAQQVLVPLADGRPVRYQRYDWGRAAYAEWVDVPAAPILLVEGCGSGSTPGAACLSMLIWVEAPHDVRMARGIGRDGDGFRPHWERWARQEAALFAAESTRERADVWLDTASGVSHDPEREVVACWPGHERPE
jgi:uridine kinase